MSMDLGATYKKIISAAFPNTYIANKPNILTDVNAGMATGATAAR